MDNLDLKYSIFIQEIDKMIFEENEVLILIRYPNQAGNRDFYNLRSPEELSQFLNSRKPLESLTCFVKPEKILSGIISDLFIKEVESKLMDLSDVDYLIIVITKEWRNQKWNFAENKSILNRLFLENMGEYVSLYIEPDWTNFNSIIHSYVPSNEKDNSSASY